MTLCAIAALAAAGAAYQSLRDSAAASRTNATFFGAVRAAWNGRTVADVGVGFDRQFPGVVAGPDVAADGSRAHTVRLILPGQPGYGVELHIVQADSSATAPPVLRVSLNRGASGELAIQPGSGRDPLRTERGGLHEYVINLPGDSTCGDNEIRVTAVSGAWVAIERLDVRVRPRAIVATLSAIALSSLIGSLALWLTAVRRDAIAAPPDRMRPRMTLRGARLALIAAALAISWLASEGLLSLLSRRSPSIRRLLYSSDETALPDTPDILTALAAHRCAESPCSVFDDGFRLNRHGFHTAEYEYAKPPGTARVLGIGDSFLFYTGPIPYEDGFFHRLEMDARPVASRPVEFINLGMMCLGIPSERALLVQEGLRLHPDVVVWTIYLGNDITDESADNLQQLHADTSSPRRGRLRPEASLVYRLLAHLTALAVRDPKLLVHDCGTRKPIAHEPVDDESRCGVLEPRELVRYDPDAKTLSDAQYVQYGVDRFRTLYVAAQQPRIHELAAAVLHQFEQVRATVVDARVIPVVIPDQFQVSASEVERILTAEPSLRRETLNFGYTADAIPRGLARLGFDVVDLRDSLRASIQAGVNPYQPNDAHLSVVGSRLVAEQVGAALRRTDLFERR